MIQPTGLAVLRELGLADVSQSRGVRIDRLFGQAGRPARPILDVRYDALRSGSAFGIGIHRASLFAASSIVDSIVRECQIQAFALNADGVLGFAHWRRDSAEQFPVGQASGAELLRAASKAHRFGKNHPKSSLPTGLIRTIDDRGNPRRVAQTMTIGVMELPHCA